MTEFFPNTDPPMPVPAVLTEEEAIRYLRLDEGSRGAHAARRALRRLVETKRLRPARIGLRNRFAREELRRFLLHATDLSGAAPGPAWGGSGSGGGGLAPSGKRRYIGGH